MDKKESGDGNILSNFSPKQVFSFGIVGGILILGTIGFIILLSLFLKGGLNSGSAGTAPAKTNTAVAPPAAAVEVSLRAVDADEDHIRGAKRPKVTIVEYSDLECPFCKSFHGTMQKVMETYGDDVQWVYRHLPLDSLHRKARTEALASECAGEQNKFWEFVDVIFANTPSNDGLDLSLLPNYARDAGLNVAQFSTCMDEQKYAGAVEDDVKDAAGAGARGTPYSILIGPDGEKTPLNGAQPFSAVEAAIQQFL